MFFASYQLAYSADSAGVKTEQIETLATGLEIPWGMTLLPDNSLLITQREGKLTLVNLQNGALTNISGLPTDIKVAGQGGLFDVALSPDYVTKQWIYFSYNKDIEAQGATTLARAQLNGHRLEQWQDLLVTHSATSNTVHYGGRITFDTDGHVFMSIGDRGIRPNAQDVTTHAGSIIRLNLDGSVPADNPFAAQDNALPELWTIGHRNPQGLFFNARTQQLWAVEHGPRGGDEINLIQAGKNYGWPVISYGMEYWGPVAVGEGTERNGLEQPVKKYVPSIAPSSLIQYMGSAFPQWQNNLLIGALKSQHLNRIELNQNNEATAEHRLLRSINGRIRNVIESPEGWLYLSTDDGRLLRVTPNSE